MGLEAMGRNGLGTSLKGRTGRTIPLFEILLARGARGSTHHDVGAVQYPRNDSACGH